MTRLIDADALLEAIEEDGWVISKQLHQLIDSAPTVQREGWVSVPIEITEDMHVAAVKAIQKCTGNDDFPRKVYKAMLSAAPDKE